MMTALHRIFAICVFGMLASCVLADVVICQGCGWEVDSSAGVCGHCGAKIELKAPAEAEADASEEKPSSDSTQESAVVSDDVVNEEVALARKYLAGGDQEMGRLFLVNASMLNLIAKSAGDTKRSEAIAKMVNQYSRRGLTVQVKCKACDGKGHRMMKVSSLLPGEGTQTREVQGSKCPVCKGTGTITRPANMDEMKYARGRAEGRFATIQRGRRFERLGGAWLPAGVAESLSVRQIAKVRSSTAPPCEECLGFGKVACPVCNGAGFLDCDECEDGNVFIKVNAELTKMTLSRSEKCKKCGGKGVLPCEKCGGKGSILCPECEGDGKMPACKKCGSQGYTVCSKCAGSGKVKGEVCEKCGGQGVLLCTSCNGDGHK